MHWGTRRGHIAQEPTLVKRIDKKFSRFISSYKEMGGAKRKDELQKYTKMLVSQHVVQVPKPELVLCKY